MVICRRCQELRPGDDFYVQKRGDRTYIGKTCKRCIKGHAKDYSDGALRRRGGRAGTKMPDRLTDGGMSGAERRAFWATYKMRCGCSDCGTHEWEVLEFDHLPQFEKLFDIGAAVHQTGIYTDQQISDEVAKCEVVCRPCHVKRTGQRKAQRARSYRW
jgi:predicted nucleic-acid-binding Zn-ribbon protein